MTTQDENQDTAQSQYFDPFPQPQTIPSGWDLSALLSTSEPASIEHVTDSAENESH